MAKPSAPVPSPIEARKARQAAALRENLLRRKQQDRARSETPADRTQARVAPMPDDEPGA